VAPKLLLADHLKILKLPTFLREYDKLACQCAAERLDPVQFPASLVALELIDCKGRTIERRIKAAKFPATESLDFKAIPKLNKMQVLELARCEWVDRRENVIALRPNGTDYTHVALGLGLAAFQKGMAVAVTTAATLVSELTEARDKRRLLRLYKQLAGVKQLIIDELTAPPLSHFWLLSQNDLNCLAILLMNLRAPCSSHKGFQIGWTQSGIAKTSLVISRSNSVASASSSTASIAC
jgi:DNA replication protein DnaC